MVKVKSRAPKKAELRPLAQKIRTALPEALRRSVVDLPATRADRASATLQASIARDATLAALHPAQAAYLYAVNQVSILAEIMLTLPALQRLADLLGNAEDEYVPGWPPLSPVSRSHFTAWAFFDAAVGIEQESIGTLLLDLAPTLALDTDLVGLLAELSRSRLGVHVHEGREDELVLLREIGSGIRRRTVAANAHLGEPGELWLARVLPPPDPSHDVHVALTSPYILEGPGEAGWIAFLKRSIPKVRARDEAQSFERLMKYGLGSSYWNEYILEGYWADSDDAIWLRGLPDIAESRPHAPSFDPAFRFPGELVRRRGSRKA